MENTNTVDAALPLQELYAGGHYAEFIKKVMDSQETYAPAQYHMLLGSAYAKKGDLAVGRYHLEKAKHLGYQGVDLNNNLAAVKQRLNLNDLASSQSFSDQLTYYSCQVPSELYWSLSLLIMIIALVVMMKNQFKKFTLPAAIIILALLPFAYERTVVKDTHFAVAIEEGSVLEGPSKIFTDKVTLPAGAQVIVGKSVDNWVFIEAPLVYSGWVDRSLLGLY